MGKVYFILISSIIIVASHVLPSKWAILLTISSGGIILTGMYVMDFLKEKDLFNPMFFFCLSYTLSLWGQAIDLFFTQSHHQRWLLLGNDFSYLVYPSQIIFVGVVSLAIGYRSRYKAIISARWPSLNYTWNAGHAKLVSRTFLLLGLIVYLSFLSIIDFSLSLEGISAKREFSTVYIDVGIKLMYVGTFIYMLDMWDRNGGVLQLNNYKLTVSTTLPYLLVIFLLIFSYPVVKSVRGELLFLVIAVLMIRHYNFRKIRAWTLLIVAPLLFVFGVLLSSLRRLNWDSSTSIVDYFNVINALRSIFGADRGGFVATAHLIQAVPETLPFQLGKSIVQWVVFPIPRSVWKDKPVHLGREIAIEIYGAPNATPPTLFGELYYNFHIIGVIVGMLLLGLFASNVYELLKTEKRPEISIGYILIANYIFGFGIITLSVINLLMLFIPILVSVIVISFPISDDESSRSAK